MDAPLDRHAERLISGLLDKTYRQSDHTARYEELRPPGCVAADDGETSPPEQQQCDFAAHPEEKEADREDARRPLELDQASNETALSK